MQFLERLGIDFIELAFMLGAVGVVIALVLSFWDDLKTILGKHQ